MFGGYGGVSSTVTSGQAGGLVGYAPYVDALYHGFDTALYRMLLECQSLGGDGVVGVRLEQRHLGQGNREFVALGTAVRAAGGQRPARLFSTTLNGQDFAKLLQGGWMPASVVIGISVAIRHDDWATRSQASAWTYNTEVSGYTELVNHVRADSRTQLTRRVAAIGADGAITSTHAAQHPRPGGRREPHRPRRRVPVDRRRHRPVPRRGRHPDKEPQDPAAVEPTREQTMTIEANELGIPEDAMRRLAEMRPGQPGALFTSDLSVNEFLLVREAGFRPLGLVLGSSIYHVGLQIGRWSQNMELDTLSQAMYHARELAMTRMEAEADALGADGIVGVRLEIEFKEFGNDLAEFIAVGTAVKSDDKGNWRNDENKPFTSDLSGQDFWTLIQAGYAPLGMVMGSCVYHIAHQGALKAMGNVGRNVEIPKFTEALYDARELAMSRMQAEAEQLKAEGIVGVQLLSLAHRSGWPHDRVLCYRHRRSAAAR